MDREKLIKLFPILEVRNRTNVSQHIQYLIDGEIDSKTITPNSRRKISSDGLLQIPDMRLFEMCSPTIFELRKAGIISLGDPVAVKAKRAPKEPAPDAPTVVLATVPADTATATVTPALTGGEAQSGGATVAVTADAPPAVTLTKAKKA